MTAQQQEYDYNANVAVKQAQFASDSAQAQQNLARTSQNMALVT